MGDHEVFGVKYCRVVLSFKEWLRTSLGRVGKIKSSVLDMLGLKYFLFCRKRSSRQLSMNQLGLEEQLGGRHHFGNIKLEMRLKEVDHRLYVTRREKLWEDLTATYRRGIILVD